MAHRFRHALALALSVATVLATAACSIGAPVTRAARTDEITVWVMQDDFSAATIDAINTRFRAQTGAEVHVQTQPWDGIATKLMTALATSNPPDVIDIGNTKVLEFARTGALLDLSAQREELAHGGTWLDGLEQPMTYDGGLYAAPAFGAARTVIYNRRMWREAGITTPPTTYDELCGDLDRVQRAHADDADFSALYLPGQNWFAGLQFLWDAGASPAELRDGQWTATLGSPNGIAGAPGVGLLPEPLLVEGVPHRGHVDPRPGAAAGPAEDVGDHLERLGRYEGRRLQPAAVRGRFRRVPDAERQRRRAAADHDVRIRMGRGHTQRGSIARAGVDLDRHIPRRRTRMDRRA